MLTSVLLALSENPVVMMQLREELSSLDVEGVLRGQLPETPYLDAVLSETERLYPPLTFALRGAMRDLEVSGYSIRKGDCVTYSPYFTGRDPELYSDPLRFDPQRFYQKKPRPYSLLGFGGGHRPCIGKRFALWEMRLFVATLLLRFDVQFGPQPSDAVYFNPTMQRRDGFWGSLSLNRAAT
jgi:cytochrome P450